MKKQVLTLVVGVVFSTGSSAFELGTLFEHPLAHEAEYNYADAAFLFNPDSFNGFELNGSYVLRPNLGITGVFNRTSADEGAADISVTQLGVGFRYFYALPTVEYTDLDLSAQLINTNVDVDANVDAILGGASDSATALFIGAQARHVLGMPVGATSLLWEEAYGGLQLSISSDDIDIAFQSGVLVTINEVISAKAELELNEGAALTLGVRMKLGSAQRRPVSGAYKAPTSSNETSDRTPGTVSPAVISPVVVQPAKSEDQYGLTADEMEGLKEALE